MVALIALVVGLLLGSLVGGLLFLRPRTPVAVGAPAPAPAPPPRRTAPPPARPVPVSPAPRPVPPRSTPVAAAPPSSAPVPAGSAQLRRDGGPPVVLGDEPVTIGRGRDQAVRIDDSRASRAHAVVRRRAKGGWELVDAGSANGTTLNGHRIPDGRVAPLRDGDEIGVGGTTLRYVEGATT